jgi:hypothetical protein
LLAVRACRANRRACSPATRKSPPGDRIDGQNRDPCREELRRPRAPVPAAAAEGGDHTVDIIGPKAGETYAGKHGYPQKSEKAASDVKAKDYALIVIPGGSSPDHMRRDGGMVIAADETAWPTRATTLENRSYEQIVRNGWGSVHRSRRDASFSELIRPAIEFRDGLLPELLQFDSPSLDSRYTGAAEAIAPLKDEFFVMCKTGGPYLRAAMMRGEENFWLDIAEDPGWAKAFVDRVADHITAVGVESIRRFGLEETGIAIYDDVAANWGTFVSPQTYERIFLPALRRMVRAYRDAGAAHVMHHSDGNVNKLLDLWVDAGIDAINPIEYRTGMDVVEIRQRYGRRLVCVGGLDNAVILPRGDRAEIRDHVRHVLSAGKEGGLVVATHSFGPDVSVETVEYLRELLDLYGGGSARA